MTATNETYLPTYEELYVPALNLTSAALKAGAVHFGKYCDLQSKVIYSYAPILQSPIIVHNFYSDIRNICCVDRKNKILENV